MSRWHDIVAAEPEFAARARRLLDAHRHKTLATLRKDGSPRISGIEASFVAGDLWLGMMPSSLKARDLFRDGRLALHSGSEDPPEDEPSSWSGDAKLAGRAIPVTDPEEARAFFAGVQQSEQPGDLFRVDVAEVVVTRVGDPADHLVIESWHEGRGLTRVTRR